VSLPFSGSEPGGTTGELPSRSVLPQSLPRGGPPMIVFQKDPNGWKKTGNLLPTETHYTIAINADKPGNTVMAADADWAAKNAG
jgi:hypothetical protein